MELAVIIGVGRGRWGIATVVAAAIGEAVAVAAPIAALASASWQRSPSFLTIAAAVVVLETYVVGIVVM